MLIALLGIIAVPLVFRRRALRLLKGMVQVAASTSTNKSGTQAVRDNLAEQTQAQAASKNRRVGRLLELAGSLGVKARILVSLAQVLSQVTTTYKIKFPDLYSKMLSALGRANFPIKLLPFGCLFPDLDNYMFDLVLETATPLFVMLVLEAIRKILQARHGQQPAQDSSGKPVGLIVADLLADINFFIGFIMYPSVSTTIFMFFMKETFGGPGEDGLTVMRYDRSIETTSALYIGFMPYALGMMLVYPVGIPLQVDRLIRSVCSMHLHERMWTWTRTRACWHAVFLPPHLQYAILLFRNRDELSQLRLIEMRIEADFEVAKVDAESAANEEQATEIMRQAEATQEERRAEFRRLRATLPTTLRKLTAGYELRCFWFEIFECFRKIALVCLPVFFSPGSPGQLILGLVICFLTCKPALLLEPKSLV